MLRGGFVQGYNSQWREGKLLLPSVTNVNTGAIFGTLKKSNLVSDPVGWAPSLFTDHCHRSCLLHFSFHPQVSLLTFFFLQIFSIQSSFNDPFHEIDLRIRYFLFRIINSSYFLFIQEKKFSFANKTVLLDIH